MSREVRKVPVNWEHPKDEKGYFIPLFGGSFKEAADRWDEGASQWDKGFVRDYATNGWKPKGEDHADITSFADWSGERPDEKDYMPDWSETERTHYQMYESVTEGTPISPVMETPEALAHWLADNKASAGPYATATYDQWLTMIHAGCSVGSFVLNKTTGEIISGVEAVSRK